MGHFPCKWLFGTGGGDSKSKPRGFPSPGTQPRRVVRVHSDPERSQSKCRARRAGVRLRGAGRGCGDRGEAEGGGRRPWGQG